MISLIRYPTCEGAYEPLANGEPLCIQSRNTSGWLRLLFITAIPFIASATFIVLVQILVRREQRRNQKSLEATAARLRAQRAALIGQLRSRASMRSRSGGESSRGTPRLPNLGMSRVNFFGGSTRNLFGPASSRQPSSNPDEPRTLAPPRAPGPAYKVGDRVYVKRSSGDECIAFVTQYDASKNYYMVDLDRIGSGKLKQCRDREMRPATQATIIVTRSNGDEKRGIVQDFDKATNRYNILLEGTGILVSATADKVRPAGPQVGSTVLVTRSGGDEKRAVVDAFDPATNMYVVQFLGAGSQFQVHADRVRPWLPKSGSRASMFQRSNTCVGLEKSLTLQLKPNEMVGMTVNEFNKVTAVEPNSPASKAGLHAGDLILAVDDVDCTEGMAAAKLWKEGAGRAVRKLRIIADANLDGSTAGGAIPRRVTVQSGTGQSGNETRGKALVAAMGTDAASKRTPVVSFRSDPPGQPRSARVADEDGSERPKQKRRPPPSAFGEAVNGVLGTALDDQLLASHPDAVELIAAGVPREEVLQGLRPRQSLRGVQQGEQATAPATAPSTASSVDGAQPRQRFSIFHA